MVQPGLSAQEAAAINAAAVTRKLQLHCQATATLPNRQRSVRYLFIPTLHRTNGRRSFNHFGQCQGMALCKKEGALFVLMCSFRGLARLSI